MQKFSKYVFNWKQYHFHKIYLYTNGLLNMHRVCLYENLETESMAKVTVYCLLKYIQIYV